MYCFWGFVCVCVCGLCVLPLFNSYLPDWDVSFHQNGNNAQAPGGEEVKTDGSSGHSQSESKEQGSAVETPATDDKEQEKKLSKRERKGERRKKMHKGEKKDKDKCNEDNRVADEEEEEKRKRKGKRRKRDEEEEEETTAELESQPKKKKKKGRSLRVKCWMKLKNYFILRECFFVV